MEKKMKRVIAVFMVLVFITTAAIPGCNVSASSLFYTGGTEKTAELTGTQGFQTENNTMQSLLPDTDEKTIQYNVVDDTGTDYEPVLYNAQDRQDLDVYSTKHGNAAKCTKQAIP